MCVVPLRFRPVRLSPSTPVAVPVAVALALALGCYLTEALSWQTVRPWGIAVALPNSHKTLAHLLTLGMLLAALGGCGAAVQLGYWQPAEGIAVEVGQALAQGESLAGKGKWVGGVGGLRLGERTDRITHRAPPTGRGRTVGTVCCAGSLRRLIRPCRACFR